jgi:hypothetical protein
VLLDGVPAAGVPVGMDFTSLMFPSSTLKTRDGDRPDPVPVLGKSMLTDANGMYEMTGLAPGFYTVEAGYLPDDGYATAWAQQNVAAGETVEMRDIHITVASRPVTPAPGARVFDPTPVFRWTPVTGADRYRVQASTGHILDHFFYVSGETEFAWPDTIAFAPGDRVRWFVDAYHGEITIGGFEVTALFSESGVPSHP